MQITPRLGETTPATEPGATAAGTSYDNSTSGSPSTNLQDEIDRLEALIASGPAPAAFVPYYIPPGGSFTVPLYSQALFADPIEALGALVVDGLLIGVD